MDYRRGLMESEFGAQRSQAAARKLLAGKAEPTPAALPPALPPALSPVSSQSVCRDIKSGAIVNCQSPHTLMIIVAGMSCMMFLVTIALFLLCWSVVRQRRVERRRRETGVDANPTSEPTPSGRPTANPAQAPVDSPEFDDAVLVQLPGDEKPQFFALPKPFLEEEDPKGAKTVADVGDSDGKSGSIPPKGRESLRPAEEHSNAIVRDRSLPR